MRYVFTMASFFSMALMFALCYERLKEGQPYYHLLFLGSVPMATLLVTKNISLERKLWIASS